MLVTEYLFIGDFHENIVVDTYVNKYVKSIEFVGVNMTDASATIKYQDTTQPDRVVSMSRSSLISFLSAYGFSSGIRNVLGKIETNMTDASVKSTIDSLVYSGGNNYFLYKLDSPKNKVEKDLIYISCDSCEYNSAISHKSMELTMKRSSTQVVFNYIYLNPFKRFYFIDKIVYTRDTMILTLVEDVLMSFSELIYQQTAYVTRNENNYDVDKIDEFVTYDYDKSITYTTPTLTNDVFDVAHPTASLGSYILITVG